MLQKQRTYTINLHLCCKCKSLKKNVISHLSTGTASLEYYISGSPNSKMIRSSEWGQTHHSPADRTLPVSHIQPPKCTELAAILHLGKDQQKLGFNKDRMGHDVSHTHTHTLKFINCPSLSLLMAPMGSANPLLHRKERVFGLRVNLEQSSATKAVFRETCPLIHILAWHKYFISRYHVCVCVRLFADKSFRSQNSKRSSRKLEII